MTTEHSDITSVFVKMAKPHRCMLSGGRCHVQVES
jgi:hypothetical protein